MGGHFEDVVEDVEGVFAQGFFAFAFEDADGAGAGRCVGYCYGVDVAWRVFSVVAAVLVSPLVKLDVRLGWHSTHRWILRSRVSPSGSLHGSHGSWSRQCDHG